MKIRRALLWLIAPALIAIGAIALQAVTSDAASRVDGAPIDAGSVKASNEFFGADHLYTFELTIASSDFEKLSPTFGGAGRGFRFSDTEYPKVPAVLRFENKTWGEIMIRYKGNSSFMGAPNALKRSLKLDFNARESKRRFFGLSTLNLNNNAFDPSQMRETLAYDVFRRADVPAPRTAFAQVYITVPGRFEREYAGLFTAVEQIDQRFFTQRWGKKVGVLLKPEELSGLPDLGKDWQRYSSEYASKVKAKTQDAERFMAFVRFVNMASDADLERHLHEYLDVDEFLRFLAVEVAIVNTDSPLSMDHNYWLTVHPATHKVVWLPWDMNESFGGFHFGDVNLSLREPSRPGSFPLAERLLAIPAFARRYDELLRNIMAENLTAKRLDAEIARLAPIIRPAVAMDRSLSIESFQESLNIGAADSDGDTGRSWRVRGFGHNGPPLRPFIHARVDAVFAQLDNGALRTTGAE